MAANPLIVAIHGPMGSGKTTLACMIQQQFPRNTSMMHAFADLLKFYCEEYYGASAIDKSARLAWGTVPKVSADKLRELFAIFSGDKYLFTKATAKELRLTIAVNLPEEPTVGNLYQAVGQAFRDVMGPDFWVDQWEDAMRQGPRDVYIVHDLRYQNECDRLVQLGAKFVYISRPNAGETGDGRSRDHPSEAGLERPPKWDFVIVNDCSKEQLMEYAKMIVASL